MSNPDLDFNASRSICFLIEAGGHRTRTDNLSGERNQCGACGVRDHGNSGRCYRCDAQLFVTASLSLKVTRRAIRVWRDLGKEGQALFLKAIKGQPMPMGSEGLGCISGSYDSDAANERSQMGIRA